jgi:hypothetical protein
LKSKKGPVIAQTIIVPSARTNASVLPVQSVALRANFSVQDSGFMEACLLRDVIVLTAAKAFFAPNGLVPPMLSPFTGRVDLDYHSDWPIVAACNDQL